MIKVTRRPDSFLEERKRQIKPLPYTVTPVADIEQYRADRAEFLAKLDKETFDRDVESRIAVSKLVADQSKELSFSEAEQDEIKYRKTRDDDYTFVPSKRYEPGTWNKENETQRHYAMGDYDYVYKEPKAKFSLSKALINFISRAFEK